MNFRWKWLILQHVLFHLHTRNDENVDFAWKVHIWNGKPMIFVETIYTQAFVKTWFFVRKITNSSTNFRWKWTILQHFALHLYTENDKNDFESKNMNFEQKCNDFLQVFSWSSIHRDVWKHWFFFSKNNDFCIKNDEFSMKNESFVHVFWRHPYTGNGENSDFARKKRRILTLKMNDFLLLFLLRLYTGKAQK